MAVSFDPGGWGQATEVLARRIAPAFICRGRGGSAAKRTLLANDASLRAPAIRTNTGRHAAVGIPDGQTVCDTYSLQGQHPGNDGPTKKGGAS